MALHLNKPIAGNEDIILTCSVGVEKIEYSEHSFGFLRHMNKT